MTNGTKYAIGTVLFAEGLAWIISPIHGVPYYSIISIAELIALVVGLVIMYRASKAEWPEHHKKLSS